MYNMELQTERLFITNLRLPDSNFIMELVNTSGWLEFIGDRNIHSNSKAKEYIQTIVENPDIDYRVVRLKASKQPIGIVTFIKKDNLDHPDIGFAFLSDFEKNGYAEEATSCVLHQLATESKFSTILAVTVPNNVKSIKLLHRLGLTYSHDIEVNQQSLNVYVASIDLILLDKLCKHFFRLFNNVNDNLVDLENLKSICVPETMIFTKKKENYIPVNLNDFISSRQKILTDGTLINFQEKEVFSNTFIKENIAQRYSEYTKSGERQGIFFTQSGSKLFQFLKNKNTWEICSIVWEDTEVDPQIKGLEQNV